MFALQHVTATDELKISFQSTANQTQHFNSSVEKHGKNQLKTLSAHLVHQTRKTSGIMQGKKSRKAKENLRWMIQKKLRCFEDGNMESSIL